MPKVFVDMLAVKLNGFTSRNRGEKTIMERLKKLEAVDSSAEINSANVGAEFISRLAVE